MSQEKNAEKQSIEQHVAALKVDLATLAGLKAFKNWATGRKVTGAEFEKALLQFNKAPADNQRRLKNG